MKKPTLWLIALTILFTSFSCSTDNTDHEVENVSSEYTVPETKVIEIEILELINEYRMDMGLSALEALDLIKSQAYVHTDYMVASSNISHDNFSQRSAFLRQYAGANRVSENVAFGYSSAASVVNAWLNSESHRGAIEGDYTHFDISAELDSRGQWYYTNIFVKR
ncbi:CAP domain-containing protein [Lacinutrix sp. C3R15]|uniref:CAP domain-containing protein n=1 Tax=Flavobacteriaceae TaxID=49546 RepID=UPI001C08FF65|nr:MULTISPECIES: CAP domain-containing protein [Flavobacteriaceae]MBU2940293.1 CAP domain-containing protein [Lacinutrix sp. C3R15]MDO6623613.1 CAP domain-containing protein [Oceanihabitans sp. 1_MG-2023]